MCNLIKLRNKKGMTVILSAVGAGLYDIILPDKELGYSSVLVRPNDIDKYDYSPSYFGKPCGRTAGRIENSKFRLDGKTYTISSKIKHALHGGDDGISYKIWSSEISQSDELTSVVFSYFSKNGESGYPGDVNFKIKYSLSSYQNVLFISHYAITNKKTLCNITNHAYFNLSGNVKDNILNHSLFINSNLIGAVDKDTIARSFIKPNVLYDFSKPHKIGDYILSEEVISTSEGYNTPYVLSNPNLKSIQASLYDEGSGRRMNIYTDYDSIMLYTCNYPENVVVENGKILKKYDAVCLECQCFPNSINSNFILKKKDILSPDEPYNHNIVLSFVNE